MPDRLKLLAVLAHPDDESLGFGGSLAKYAAEGVEVSLIVATRGERGWRGPADDDPGLEAVGGIREREVCAAAEVLGIGWVRFLDLIDGEMHLADHRAAAARIAAQIRELRPQVVLTFDPRGGYGHPDHIAISQLALSAVVLAADPTAAITGSPFSVSKFYYRVWNREENGAFERVFGVLALEIDGETRRIAPWEEWSITTRIDTGDQMPLVWTAIQKHASQVGSIQKLAEMPERIKAKLFGSEGYYRAFSLVNGGGEREDDLFAGLRK
ncbi:MAG TPA: PIG-L deacetylase family protein [Anaerolineales bacterium]|nr:PIG-L deacetylase family protein [Anaerolineales bacterium]